MIKTAFPPEGFVPAESAVAGITVYMPAPPEESLQEVVDFRCPQCNGATAYCTSEGALTCTFCGYHEEPEAERVGRAAEEFEFTVETMQRASRGWGEKRKELECYSCGAHTTLPLTMLTHTCPFCSSNRVVQLQAAQDVLRPRFLIPFAVSEDACRQKAREWLGSSWMTPPGLKRLARAAEFTPIYIPFWTFDARAHANWRAEVGHTRTRTVRVQGRIETRTYIEWRWESGAARRVFDDLLLEGTSKLHAHLLDQIRRYDLNQLVAYEAAFLAGIQAQAYDINLETSWERARHTMRQRVKEACKAQASNSRIRNFSMTLDFSDESWRYILLPLYLASYRYGDKSYQVLINGQTGALAGQRPVAWGRVALGAAGMLAPGVFLLLLALLLLALAVTAGIGVIVLFLALIALFIGVLFAGHTLWQAWHMRK